MDDANAPGTAKPAEVVKAGCGIRFDPEALPADTGFDFSQARKLLDASRAASDAATDQAQPAPPPEL